MRQLGKLGQTPLLFGVVGGQSSERLQMAIDLLRRQVVGSEIGWPAGVEKSPLPSFGVVEQQPSLGQLQDDLFCAGQQLVVSDLGIKFAFDVPGISDQNENQDHEADEDTRTLVDGLHIRNYKLTRLEIVS
jgi:hypothetical protein